MDEDFKEVAKFHGHICPGLAIGYRVAKYVKEHYPRSVDEELVCIAENNSCSVDALQAALGCTFGKGNLIFKDFGKQAFTIYSRNNGKALRIYFKGDVFEGMDDLRKRYLNGALSPAEKQKLDLLREDAIKKILTAPDEEILSVREVEIPTPEKARIHPSVRCQECGESFMEIRGRTANGKMVCQECFDKMMC
ncbi:MAG: formylmethanofuran dehydrogenase [Methanothrix sp.]|nr:formylmethanofuran dehydrogenase [Methanothrix sp.]